MGARMFSGKTAARDHAGCPQKSKQKSKDTHEFFQKSKDTHEFFQVSSSQLLK
jgi:hypothetical protein